MEIKLIHFDFKDPPDSPDDEPLDKPATPCAEPCDEPADDPADAFVITCTIPDTIASIKLDESEPPLSSRYFESGI